jgi:hypothetical protein
MLILGFQLIIYILTLPIFPKSSSQVDMITIIPKVA